MAWKAVKRKIKIFILKTLNLLRSLSKKKFNSGFTLIEILVALALVTLILMVVMGGMGSFSSRDKLEQNLEKIERSIRYSRDESILRNSVVRVHFNLNKDPQEFFVEFGPSDNFVLSQNQTYAKKDLSLDELEKLKKEQKQLNSEFQKVPDMSHENFMIETPLTLIGMGSSLTKRFVIEGEPSLYVYPSGEKDRAFVSIANETELGVLTTQAYGEKISIDYYKLNKSEGDILEQQIDRSEELFKQWLESQKF